MNEQQQIFSSAEERLKEWEISRTTTYDGMDIIRDEFIRTLTRVDDGIAPGPDRVQKEVSKS